MATSEAVNPRTSTVVPQPTPTRSPSATPRPSEGAATATTPPDNSAIPAQTLAVMQAIEAEVSQLRQLQPDNSEYTRLVLSPEQLSQRVETDFLKDYPPEEAHTDQIVYASLGLLEPGFDLLAFFEELLSEQVAGFYDDDTHEMVVVGDGAFDGTQKSTYAHEYTHTLQDQNFKIKTGLRYDDAICELETERCTAVQALLEGDASLAEENWFINYATLQDQRDLLQYYSTADFPVFERAPAFLQEDFLFPYIQGSDFVRYYYEQQEWAGVNALYAQPPVSTEQILHPEKYPADLPQTVNLPVLADELGSDWQLIYENNLGEWYTYLLLARGFLETTRLPDETASDAAAGWGGDRFQVYYNDQLDRPALILRSRWDTVDDAQEFAQAFEQYATQLLVADPQQTDMNTWIWTNTDQYFYFSLDPAQMETTWISTPDEATANQLLAALAAP
ncbi:MAG: hypothetical protein ACK2UW_24015 [Anaerolineales bacterium]